MLRELQLHVMVTGQVDMRCNKPSSREDRVLSFLETMETDSNSLQVKTGPIIIVIQAREVEKL